MGLAHILITAVNAVMPIILLIVLGYFLKQKGFLTEEFLKIGNKLMFKICLPVMLFVNVYEIDNLGSIHWHMVIYTVVMSMVIFLLGMVTAVVVTNDPKRRGVIWQCSFRSNYAIIGLTLAEALGGGEAVSHAAVLSAFIVPLINTLSVVSLSTFDNSGKHKMDIKGLLLNVLKNPLIWAVAIGLVILAIRSLQTAMFGAVVFSLERDMKFFYTALSYLKSITSPLALIVLGGQFEFSAVSGLRREITAGTLWRVLFSPVLGIGAAILFSNVLGLMDLGPAHYPALIAHFASPVAVSSAIMAEQMDNDKQLATQLVVWTSLCSMVSVFLVVCVLMSLGLVSV